jgi:DNA-directed RNA polymerase subunit RPC12/RpoP
MVKYYVEQNQAWETEEYECPRCGKVTRGEDLPFNDFSDDGLEYYECPCGKRLVCVSKSAPNFIFGNDKEEHQSHLGWEFFVFKKSDTDAKGPYRHGLRFLARWESGLGGDKWIEDLVASGKASPQHQEYMRTCSVSAGVINEVLRNGIPKHTGPDVVGDDYYMHGGWAGNALFDWKALRELSPDEMLVVDMFDES